MTDGAEGPDVTNRNHDDPMQDPTRDPLIDRVAASLQAMPPVSPSAKARILALVDAADVGADEPDVAARPAAPARDADVVPLHRADGSRVLPLGLPPRLGRVSRAPRRPALLASMGALAAAMLGFAVRDLLDRRPAAEATAPMVAEQPATGAHAGESTGTALVAGDEKSAALAPIATQFVLNAPNAARVSLVGEFNDWDPARAPLARDAGGVWSIVVPLVPGRHVYAFVVDDTVWTLDPRAPKADDPDFGRAGSVVLVGRP